MAWCRKILPFKGRGGGCGSIGLGADGTNDTYAEKEEQCVEGGCTESKGKILLVCKVVSHEVGKSIEHGNYWVAELDDDEFGLGFLFLPILTMLLSPLLFDKGCVCF